MYSYKIKQKKIPRVHVKIFIYSLSVDTVSYMRLLIACPESGFFSLHLRKEYLKCPVCPMRIKPFPPGRSEDNSCKKRSTRCSSPCAFPSLPYRHKDCQPSPVTLYFFAKPVTVNRRPTPCTRPCAIICFLIIVHPGQSDNVPDYSFL